LDGEFANIWGIKAQKMEASILAAHKTNTTMIQLFKAGSMDLVQWQRCEWRLQYFS